MKRGLLARLLGTPQVEPANGGLRVETSRQVLSDRERSRTIPLSTWSPDGDGPFPVVVLSHGMGETGESYAWLGRSLASSGYWVVAPTHFGSDREVLDREGFRGIIAATRRPEMWRDRFDDIRCLLNSIESGGQLAHSERAHPGSVAVVGHSAGGFTACAVAGLQLGSSNFRDGRVGAVVSMSMPRLTAVVANEAWSTIEVPALHITGTLDVSPHYGTFRRHRRIPFENAAARGDQFLVTLRGASHSTYSAPVDGDGTPTHHLQNCVAMLTTLFLDGWLQGRGVARAGFRASACDSIRLEER